MKLNRKLLIIAKGISVWWGIYLILGCCAGFVIRTIQTVFLSADSLDLMMYIPFMCMAALVLAVITYFVSLVIKGAPRKKIRRELFEVMKNEGFTNKYMSILFDSAREDMKKLAHIEASMVYCLRGEAELASKVLAEVDPVSIIDIAQSTGDIRMAAYYYSAKLVLAVLNHTEELARAYDSGLYYFDVFAGNDIIMAVLALYRTEAGLYNSAITTIEKIKWNSLPRNLRCYGKSFSAVIKAKNLFNIGRFDDAIIYARMSLSSPCTEHMAAVAEDIIKKAKLGKISPVAYK